jgi:putative hydrolase of the HAD superfamily
MSEMAHRVYSTYLFDVGGTLIKFDERRRATAYAERAASVGVQVATQDAARVLAALDDELPERTRHLPLSLLPVSEQRAFWLDFWAEGFRQFGVAETDALRFANDLLDPVHGGNFQSVFEDVVPALHALQARGKQLGIISNFSPNCETLLRGLGLAQYFDFFIVSGILGVEKPDPRIFHAAIDAAGKPVAELVYVGDSVFHDVEGAQAAGMDAILIDRADRFSTHNIQRVHDLREL